MTAKPTERDLIEEVSMATPKTSDTIILHPNNDGTYHWMCPNCKREDLGLSAETNLEDYLPNIACPNCGFQFGVDKRYLSTSYICGECLVVQRFDETCGNCGARAMRRASTPVPLAPPRDTVKEAEALLAAPDRSKRAGYSLELLRRLVAEVRRLREETSELRDEVRMLDHD